MTEQIVPARGRLTAALFDSGAPWKREPPPGLNQTTALFPRIVPSSTVTTSLRFGSGVNRKGCSASGTPTTHDRHIQEQHRYVQATDREARINRKPARLHANDRCSVA